MTQLVMWVMLQVTKLIACAERNLFIVDVIVSAWFGPAWKPIGSPRRSSSR